MNEIEQVLDNFRNTSIVYISLNKERKNPMTQVWQTICQRAMETAFEAGYKAGKSQ